MTDINSISFALDPANVPAFLLDWEVTKKCNLDCSYCLNHGLDAGHDNTTEHPPLTECLETIDFMYKYVDMYMEYKKPTQRKVIFNVYGGESLHHPDIEEIFKQCYEKYQPFKDRWHLTITCTTNGIVGPRRLNAILPYVNEFTVSYHADSLGKQEQQFFNNIKKIQANGNRLKVAVMMHNAPAKWKKSMNAIEFCKQNNIRYLPKTIDNVMADGSNKWHYTQDQMTYLGNSWQSMANKNSKDVVAKKVIQLVKEESTSVIHEGRACCGGRKLAVNGDLKSSTVYIPKQGFRDWYCSVNWFFLHVRQLDRGVYTNKDCKTSLAGAVEPLGYVHNGQEILDNLRHMLDTKTMPKIQCIKDICKCGYCAPKAFSKTSFDDLLTRYVVGDVFSGVDK